MAPKAGSRPKNNWLPDPSPCGRALYCSSTLDASPWYTNSSCIDRPSAASRCFITSADLFMSKDRRHAAGSMDARTGANAETGCENVENKLSGRNGVEGDDMAGGRKNVLEMSGWQCTDTF